VNSKIVRADWKAYLWEGKNFKRWLQMLNTIGSDKVGMPATLWRWSRGFSPRKPHADPERIRGVIGI